MERHWVAFDWPAKEEGKILTNGAHEQSTHWRNRTRGVYRGNWRCDWPVEGNIGEGQHLPLLCYRPEHGALCPLGWYSLNSPPFALTAKARGRGCFHHPHDGRLLLHRLIQNKGTNYLMKGDNILDHNDGWVRWQQLLGKVNRVDRGDRWFALV